MQLSLHAEYSCRVLMYLALRPPKVKSSIEEIAAAYGISENHLVKVVHRLGKLGFIQTTRGRGGGIVLGRTAKSINIGAVIRQMEPGFTLVECFDASTNACPAIGACALKPWLVKATNAFLAVLDELTLADITVNRARLAASLGITNTSA